MNPLRARFSDLYAAGRKALLPYITAGYPDVDTTLDILRRVDPARCACAELGIPFSDPIADGPVIQTSFQRALAAGFSLDGLLQALRAAREDIAVPLVAMVSYSIVHRRTPRGFVEAAVRAGVTGLIVPDLAIEEADELAELGSEMDCPLIAIVAPTTEPARRGRIAAVSEPFIYYQSLAGVTGERDRLPSGLAESGAPQRRGAGEPGLVGVGVSTPKHVAEVCAAADGAIVGSAIVRRMTEALDAGGAGPQAADAATAIIEQLAAAVAHQPS
jgi:tryptophan synthase alpha chain